MPPRYAYWTIIVDDQATAFRAGAQDELMPTFKRLQQKHPSAKMMWFQNGKLWPSRIDAREAMHARGEMGRRGDERQSGPRTSRPSFRDKPEWKPPSTRSGQGKPEWKPKGAASERGDKPAWRPKDPSTREHFRDAKPSARSGQGTSPDRRPARDARPSWKPPSTREGFRDAKPSARSGHAKPEWKPKGEGFAKSDRKPRTEWRPKAPSTRERFHDAKPSARSGQAEKLEWKPRGEAEGAKPQAPSPRSPEKRKWVPKEEYKKSLGIEARRDKNWRPGGEHKDPRQKYKDAKKAKWTRFKQTVRKRWEGKPGKKSGK